MAGKGGMTLTGQLGDVMKESAQAALCYLRSKAEVAGDQPELPREDGHPPPLPGGLDPQGRPVRGRDHPHRAHLADDRHPGAQRHGDDRRGHAARPGAAGGRHQGEGARGAPRGHQAGHPARALPQGPDRRAGAGEEGARVHLRHPDGRGARAPALETDPFKGQASSGSGGGEGNKPGDINKPPEATPTPENQGLARLGSRFLVSRGRLRAPFFLRTHEEQVPAQGARRCTSSDAVRAQSGMAVRGMRSRIWGQPDQPPRT